MLFASFASGRRATGKTGLVRLRLPAFPPWVVDEDSPAAVAVAPQRQGTDPAGSHGCTIGLLAAEFPAVPDQGDIPGHDRAHHLTGHLGRQHGQALEVLPDLAVTEVLAGGGHIGRAWLVQAHDFLYVARADVLREQTDHLGGRGGGAPRTWRSR